MSFTPGIAPGAVLSNKEISAIFGCSIEGGIRKSKKNNCLVIIVNNLKPGHNDHWEGDILYFSGRGENMDSWQNRALAQSSADNMPVFLFELVKEGQYAFNGQVRVISEPFIETLTDADGNDRKMLTFKLKKV